MRFFNLDGKIYEVDCCEVCNFFDPAIGECYHPERPSVPMLAPPEGVHELCPLREVEHNMPHPPYRTMNPIVTKTMRASLIGTISKGKLAMKPYRLGMPFVNSGDNDFWREYWKRFAEYFSVELKEIVFPGEDKPYGHATIIAHYDWSPEKVGDPDLIPFAPQREIAK